MVTERWRYHVFRSFSDLNLSYTFARLAGLIVRRGEKMNAQVIPLPRRTGKLADAGLSDQDCFAIAAGLHALPGGSWLAQRDEEADGSVVMTLVADDEDALPAFVVRRDAAGFRLDSGTSSRSFGRYGDLAALLWSAGCLLGGDPGGNLT